MLSFNRILKDYRESGALNALVAIHTAVGHGVFATKSGDLVMFLSVHGTGSEHLDAAQRDARARHFESVLRTIDQFRIYQYVLKREAPELPARNYADRLVQEAVNSRLQYLETRMTPLYSLEVYYAVVYEGAISRVDQKASLLGMLANPKQAIAKCLLAQHKIENLQEQLSQSIEFLTNKVHTVVVQLRDLLCAEPLDTQAAFRVLRRFLNFAPHKVDLALKYPAFVDFQCCDSTLECHRDYLRLDDYYVQVLTLKEPPGQTYAQILSELAELPANCIVGSEWKSETPLKARKFIESKRRHFHNSKTSITSFMTSNPSAAPRDMLVNEGAAAVVGNLGGCLKEIEVDGRSFGQFSLTIVLYDKDLSRLRRATAQCFKIFATHDAQLIEESYNRLNAFLAVLPGNTAYNLRRLWLLDSNYADLSFLTTANTGSRINEHLGTEYLAVVEGPGRIPYFLNLHYKDVAHSLILGSTGSGKSFLINFLLTHLQKVNPVTTIFDLGGSYESLTRLFGGAYVPIGKVQNAVRINPFCLAPTKENFLFLFAFVKVLVESGGYRATAGEEQDLFEQIENLYSVPPDQRRLLTLANIVPRNLRQQLQKWVAGGPYAALFDNVEDNLTLQSFQTFDFEGMDKLPDQLEPLLFYVLHRSQTTLNDPALLTRFKVFVVDEAWRFFRNPVVKAYIVEALKTWRKRNAAMIVATQSSDDLLASDLLPVLVESCPTKMFLANPGMDQTAYQAAFHLNETEAELIARLVPKQQFLFKQPDVAKLLHLDVGPKEYWLYTTTPAQVRRRSDAFERYGFEKGLEILAKETV